MDTYQIKLVQDSFAKIQPASKEMTEMLYGRLFEIAPEVRPLFRGDLRKQGAMLISTLQLAVSSLDRLEMILPAVRSLGQRHAGYGVTGQHYQYVGEAIIWTLRQMIGSEFNSEVESAWLAAYTILATAMIEAEPLITV